jgi:hypothetical protein
MDQGGTVSHAVHQATAIIKVYSRPVKLHDQRLSRRKLKRRKAHVYR